jgi:hypothetical protein
MALIGMYRAREGVPADLAKRKRVELEYNGVVHVFEPGDTPRVSDGWVQDKISYKIMSVPVDYAVPTADGTTGYTSNFLYSPDAPAPAVRKMAAGDHVYPLEKKAATSTDDLIDRLRKQIRILLLQGAPRITQMDRLGLGELAFAAHPTRPGHTDWRDLFGGFAPPSGLPGGIGILPKTGAQGWPSGGGKGESGGAGKPVRYASGPGPSSSTPAGTGGSASPSGSSGHPDASEKPGLTTSTGGTPTAATSGAAIDDDYDPLNDLLQSYQRQHDSEVQLNYSPKKTPDRARESSELSGNAAIDAGIMRNARFQAGFAGAPLGPVRAFTPDAGVNDPDLSGEIDWSLLDPVAPVAQGYERSRVRAGSARRTRIQHPGILALYPEGGTSGGDGEDDETVEIVERLLLPKEAPPAPQGDPAAHRGQVTAVSGGVRSATLSAIVGRVRSSR